MGRTGLKEIVWEGVDVINLDQDTDRWRALLNTVNEPLSFIKGEEILD
jgi:hypothetical protein